jgi:hypothetical protein
MTILEHFSVIRWHDGVGWVDITAEIAACALTLTRQITPVYTLGESDPLLVAGGRGILLTLDVVRETTSGFYGALLSAAETGAPLMLELCQPDAAAGAYRASGNFVIREVIPLRAEAGGAGTARALLVGGRGFTGELL